MKLYGYCRVSTIDVTDANIDLSESELEYIELQGELLKYEKIYSTELIEKPKKLNMNLHLNTQGLIFFFFFLKLTLIEMVDTFTKALISAYKRDLPTLIAGGAYRFEGKGVEEDKDNVYSWSWLKMAIICRGKTMGQIREA